MNLAAHAHDSDHVVADDHEPPTELDPVACYRALESRDARFDGRFFTAVRTTGIYCRPICSARTPRFANVCFYRCAAAAEVAGYRPCKRCRPDAAPGTPQWRGTADVVSRALSMLRSGALATTGIEMVAERLGVSSRHLTRLFREQLGVSPSAVAQSYRNHFARQLIDETTLSMTDVAFEAGFTSVRRFNSAIRSMFGCTPTELRARQSRLPPELFLHVAYRPPFDFDFLLRFLSDRAIGGVEEVDDGCYRRTVTLDGADRSAPDQVIEVRNDATRRALTVRVLGDDHSGVQQTVARVRALFDVDADPERVESRLSADPVLAPFIASGSGIRVPGAYDPFEVAVRAIVGQQVSVRAATTVAGRLAARHGRALAQPLGSLTHCFPTPEALASATTRDTQGWGMPSARANAIRMLARAVVESEVSFDPWCAFGEVRERLLRLPGIGPWTAEYIAMRAIRDPDAFPTGDLGLRVAMPGGKLMWTPRRLSDHAESWRPWRAYAALLLWRSLGVASGG